MRRTRYRRQMGPTEAGFRGCFGVAAAVLAVLVVGSALAYALLAVALLAS